MKRIYLLITLILSLTLSVSSVSASNGNEIIPFHPDPSLVTEWNILEDGYLLEDVIFDTPILKVIIPEGAYDPPLSFDGLESSVTGEGILWIYSEIDEYIQVEIEFYDSYISTIWFGGRQTEEPLMEIIYLYIDDGYDVIEEIYLYPDVYIIENRATIINSVNIYSYNFEYELYHEYQLGYNDGYDIGYNDGWGEKNKMTDITFLIIGLIIFIIANVLGFIYKINLLIALSGLLWLLPIFLVDNVFIKIFSVIIMLITFIFSFKERSDYYV